MFYDRISTHDYEECQDDILAVSGMAEDIRDALLDYQVGDDTTHAASVPLKSKCLDRWPINGRHTTKTAGLL